MSKIKLTDKEQKMLLSIKYDTNTDGSVVRNVVSVNDKTVGMGVYPFPEIETKFCERMVELGLMHEIVASWGYQELQYCVTDIGKDIIRQILNNNNAK